MKTLRPYQDAALKSLWQYIYNNPGKHPLIVAPVAAGKSLLIGEFVKQVHEEFPRTRIVVMAHVKELLVQNADELRDQYPHADLGFYCAGLGQKRIHNDITFASVQSIYKKINIFSRAPEILIIDEAHLISPKQSTTYKKFINDVLERNPNCKVIGFTGTPFRADTGRLDEGEGRIFDGVAYEIPMSYMIEEGYWAKPVAPKTKIKMDVTGLKKQGGDYNTKDLEKRINTSEVTDPCVEEMIEKGKDRKKWLIFTAGVEHAQDVTDSLIATGVDARCVHSKKSKDENDEILKAHRAGEFKALVNIAKLTTGYNDPEIDMLVYMRPTRSPVLYIQMTGRGVRVIYADGHDLSTTEGRLNAIMEGPKPDCLLLDFGGVVSDLGPIDQVSIKKVWEGDSEPGEKVGEAITKICPSCGTECAASQRYCYSCSYCFIQLTDRASDNAVVSVDIEPEWMPVYEVYQDKHQKVGGDRSMKVSYTTMAGFIREWVCFEHHKYEPGNNKRYAWDRAVEWHRERMPDIDIPTSVDVAVKIKYPKPLEILVRPRGKFFDVLDYKFKEETEGEMLEEKEDEFFEIPF